MAADRGCERDVVHRMNEGYRTWGTLNSVLSSRGLLNIGLGIKEKEVSIRRRNCTNRVVRSRGMGYEKWRQGN